jgi:type IV secretory pathway TraG/TraD family ATPase VirD4
MISAAMSTFKSKPEGQGYRCMFLMDEFANLGFIDEMPVEISVAAGHGIDFTLIVQGLDQLKETYGDSDGTILGNCAFKWFCNVGDNDTADYLNKYLGKKTVRTISKGESEGHPVGPTGHAQEGKSTTYGEVQRDLLQPSEILNLGKNVAILIAPGSLPKYLRPIDYWQIPEAFVMFRDSSPKLFWDPPLFYDPNPLEPASRGSGSVPAKSGEQRGPDQKKPAGEGSTGNIDLNYYSPLNPVRSKPSQPPPPEKPAEKPSSPNYDPSYYSPQRIAEREREAAKKTSPPTPKKPPKLPGGDWDPDADTFVPFPPNKPEGGGDT